MNPEQIARLITGDPDVFLESSQPYQVPGAPDHPTTDVDGIKVDKRIANIVRILRTNGISTLCSCQGDSNEPAYIDIDTVDAGKFRSIIGKKPRWLSIRVDRSKHRKRHTYVEFPIDKTAELEAILKT